MNYEVIFYLPNIVDYVRIVLLVISIFLENRAFAMLYGASVSLDYFDGLLARTFNQTSMLGGALDMVIDRISTMVILMKITVSKSVYAPWCMLYAVIDFMSHFIYFLVSAYTGVHHKIFSSSTLLSYYYTPGLLYLLCFGSELGFITTYLSKSRNNMIKVLQGICAVKLFFHIVHFIVGVGELSKLNVK